MSPRRGGCAPLTNQDAGPIAGPIVFHTCKHDRALNNHSSMEGGYRSIPRQGDILLGFYGIAPIIFGVRAQSCLLPLQ
jgi:hypothetical protein